jgi:inositol-phosphate phosphatase / L-galactose 1-phosphate phosphatase / histidinol-phosphatase
MESCLKRQENRKKWFDRALELASEGGSLLGIIVQPILGERWVGCEGTPTTFNDVPCRVRTCEKLSDAVAATTTPTMFTGREDVLARLTKETKSLAFGGDCYAYAMLASGFVDLVVEADLKPYDFMAVVPIVQGAGGVMTDWEGGALHIASRGEVIAAGGRSENLFEFFAAWNRDQ